MEQTNQEIMSAVAMHWYDNLNRYLYEMIILPLWQIISVYQYIYTFHHPFHTLTKMTTALSSSVSANILCFPHTLGAWISKSGFCVCMNPREAVAMASNSCSGCVRTVFATKCQLTWDWFQHQTAVTSVDHKHLQLQNRTWIS